MLVEEKFNRWLNDEGVSLEEKKILKSLNKEEINDAFYRDLEFGTAGIRGILGPGSNRLNKQIVKKATVGFALYLLETYKNAKEAGVCISHDNRLYSREFTLETARVLASFGIKSYIFDSLRPTPELSFAVRYKHAVGGVMITASHNPKEYNGYKVYDENGCQLVPSKIKRLVEIINNLGFELDVKEGNENAEIITLEKEVDEKYCEEVISISLNKDLEKKVKIVFSPQHGTSYVNAMKIFHKLQYDVIEVKEQCTPDPLFSNTKSPNPENKEAYELALDYAKKYDADLILTTDPDADRVGIAFKNSHGEYQLYTGNQTGALLINYVLSQRKAKNELSSNGVLFDTIVTSSLGEKIAKDYGLTVESLLTGFKFIGDRIHHYEITKEKTFEFGYEESYGYLIKPFVRDKDSLQALVMISEMTNYYLLQNKRLDEIMDEIQRKYGYHHDELYSIYFEGQQGGETMQKIMQEVRENPFKEIAGHKVEYYEDYLKLIRYKKQEEKIVGIEKSNVLKYYLDDGSTVAIRPSGTEPKCKFYYGAVGKDTTVIEKPKLLHKAILKSLKLDK